MLTGPRLYQPSPSKKRWADAAYLQVLEQILPNRSGSELLQDMLPGRLWHDDLHDENIFVNPDDPAQITAIIDWQSTQIVPLFDHHMDPAFLDYNGSDIGEDLEPPGRLDTTGMSPEEKSAAIAEYLKRGIMVAWRRLVRGKSPVQYRAIQFQQSTTGHVLYVARRTRAQI